MAPRSAAEPAFEDSGQLPRECVCVSEQHLDVFAQPTRLAPRTSRWRVPSNSELGLRLSYVGPPSTADIARTAVAGPLGAKSRRRKLSFAGPSSVRAGLC